MTILKSNFGRLLSCEAALYHSPDREAWVEQKHNMTILKSNFGRRLSREAALYHSPGREAWVEQKYNLALQGRHKVLPSNTS